MYVLKSKTSHKPLIQSINVYFTQGPSNETLAAKISRMEDILRKKLEEEILKEEDDSSSALRYVAIP
jgi:hypothetical protein